MGECEYKEMRNEFKPDELKLIFISESPPKSGKYFYNKEGKITENLFNYLMKALCIDNFKSKEEKLKEFAKRGYILTDSTYKQINGKSNKDRKKIILNDYEDLKKDLDELTNYNRSPVPIILLKATILEILERKLREDGFKIINNGKKIPFPSCSHQNEFVEVLKNMF